MKRQSIKSIIATALCVIVTAAGIPQTGYEGFTAKAEEVSNIKAVFEGELCGSEGRYVYSDNIVTGDDTQSDRIDFEEDDFIVYTFFSEDAYNDDNEEIISSVGLSMFDNNLGGWAGKWDFVYVGTQGFSTNTTIGELMDANGFEDASEIGGLYIYTPSDKTGRTFSYTVTIFDSYPNNNIQISDENDYITVDKIGEKVILAPTVTADDYETLKYRWFVEYESLVDGKIVKVTEELGSEPELEIAVERAQADYYLTVSDSYGNGSDYRYRVCIDDGTYLSIYASDADNYITYYADFGSAYFKHLNKGEDLFLKPEVEVVYGDQVSFRYEWYEGYSDTLNVYDAEWSYLGDGSSISVENWNGEGKTKGDGHFYRVFAIDEQSRIASLVYVVNPYYVNDYYSSSISGTPGEKEEIKLGIYDPGKVLRYLWYGDFVPSEDYTYDRIEDDIIYTDVPSLEVDFGLYSEGGDDNYDTSAHAYRVYDDSKGEMVASGDIYFCEEYYEPDVVITGRPQDVSTVANKTVQFHVDAESKSNKELHYQWYVATSENAARAYNFKPSGLTGNKTDTLTLKATQARNGYVFACEVTEENGEEASGWHWDWATLDVNEIPVHGFTYTSDGKEVENPSVTKEIIYDGNGNVLPGTIFDVSSGKNVSIKANAEGEGLTYQWYVSSDGCETWKKSGMSGNKTDTISFTANTSRDGYRFKCQISDKNGNSRETEIVSLRVDVFYVLGNDYDIFAKYGENIDLGVWVAYGRGVTYQWECSKDGGETWIESSLEGNKTNALKFKAIPSRDGYIFRFKATNDGGKTIYSPKVYLHVDPINIVNQPKVSRKINGETEAFRVDALGDGLSYQWQTSKDLGITWTNSALKGNKTNELTVGATSARNGYLFRCVICDKHGNKKNSQGVILRVGDRLIASQPVSVTSPKGKTVKYSVKAEKGSTYQWQVSTDGGKTWKNSGFSGNKTSALSVSATAARNGYRFRCVVRNNYFEEISECAALYINGMVHILTEPENISTSAGKTVKFTVNAEGAKNYQWQVSTDGGNIWKNSGMTGNRTNTLTVKATAARNGYLFRCVMTDSNGGTATSSAVELAVE